MRNFEKDNTVAAENQLPQGQRLTSAEGGAAFRVLFVGNSITRHGPKPDIGWPWDGAWPLPPRKRLCAPVHAHAQMPDSRREPPHRPGRRLGTGILAGPGTAARIRRALEPKNDLIVVRLGENVPEEGMRQHSLAAAFEDMLRFFRPMAGSSSSPICSGPMRKSRRPSRQPLLR